MEENIFPETGPVQALNRKIALVRQEIGKVIVGQDEVVNLLMTGLLCDGHLLLEGVPGVAKTLAAKLLARIISVDFSRLQFTPDLMPGDVLGTAIFNPQAGSFTFKPGPIFSNIILIDEINRAPAKTQSALFEVMEEKQVTVDGQTHGMSYPFLVIATQNPVEQEGTYRLPEAQLDRFLFKIDVGYPKLEDEIEIMTRQQGKATHELLHVVQPVFTADELREYRAIAQDVKVEPHLINFIARIVHETRNNNALYLGASPRASLALLKASKAQAAIRGRDFVIPEDIMDMAGPVLRHRIMLTPEKEMEGIRADDIIKQLITEMEIPR